MSLCRYVACDQPPVFIHFPGVAGCMYGRILVPTDGSDHSDLAAEHAIGIAEQSGGVVHALFVVEQAGPTGHWNVPVERQEETGEEALDVMAARGNEHGIEVKRHLRRGTPTEEIVDAANDYEVDLIVMGTQGRTGFSRIATAGSTTERVVRLTDIPTLVVGGAGTGDH
jgi:nucleotide-binding universal stress UspA family protein